MNLVEQIRKGVELIEMGKALGKDTASIQDKVKTLQARLNKEVEQLKLSEFERRDIAVEIYSEFFQCNLWLCSNEDMAAQIKKDDPSAVYYTVGELRMLIRLKPDPVSLKSIHEAKVMNPGSEIKEVVMNDDNKVHR